MNKIEQKCKGKIKFYSWKKRRFIIMRGNKRLVQSIAVAGATGILVFTVTFSQPQIMQTEETIQEDGTAVWILDESINDYSDQEVTIEKHESYKVAASVPTEDLLNGEQQAVSSSVSGSSDQAEDKDTQAEDEEENKKDNAKENIEEETKEITKEDKKEDTKNTTQEKTNTEKTKNSTTKKQNTAKSWKNKLMADVDDYLNIRESSNEESKIVGKLRKGDVAKVVKKGKVWTKIKSGSVSGYVKNEYCVYGTKAYKLAKKICDIYATVQADGLRIRKHANENAIVLEAAFKGDRLRVNTKAKKKDGWVVVSFNDLKGYVSKEFVNVGLGTGVAISIEEEQAQIAAKKKAEKASSASTAASSSSAVSSSDLTLLSAIIFCEAGGESYAGQVAVGAVVMNRVKSGSYPNTISGVVYQSGQFSPVANGALARALSNGNYQHCTSAARAALAGSDNTGGAKFFHRVNGAAGLVIGNHVFY